MTSLKIVSHRYYFQSLAGLVPTQSWKRWRVRSEEEEVEEKEGQEVEEEEEEGVEMMDKEEEIKEEE